MLPEKSYSKNPSKIPKLYGVYIPSILTTKLVLHISEIGKNLKQNLEKKLVQKISNKCIPEGYVKPQSVKIQSYSAGVIPMSANITYIVVYECMICYPVEGMIIETKVKNITKAGFRCEVMDESGNIPIIAFVIREHNIMKEQFNTIKESDDIHIRVIGVTFELNDPYISIIGELINKSPEKEEKNKKMKQIQYKIKGGDVSSGEEGDEESDDDEQEGEEGDEESDDEESDDEEGEEGDDDDDEEQE